MQMKSWNKKLKNRMIAGILAINTLASYGIASALSLAPETPESETTRDIVKALNSSCGIKHTSGIGYDVLTYSPRLKAGDSGVIGEAP